ncbi:MAG: PspA/IM30 family protein [Armatimonadota bacterium]
MGILTRVRRIVSANVNDVVDKAENPEKMVKQLIREMEQSISETKAATANALANQKKLERKQAENAAEAQQWDNRAALALEKGDEDLARQALRRKKIYADLEQCFVEQVESQKRTVEALKTSIDALNAKLDEAKARAKLVIARSRRTKVQKKVARTMGKVGDTSAFREFERIAEHVDDEELTLAAAAELDVDTLEEKFRKDEEDAEIEFELQELRERVTKEGAEAVGETDEGGDEAASSDDSM